MKRSEDENNRNEIPMLILFYFAWNSYQQYQKPSKKKALPKWSLLKDLLDKHAVFLLSTPKGKDHARDNLRIHVKSVDQVLNRLSALSCIYSSKDKVNNPHCDLFQILYQQTINCLSANTSPTFRQQNCHPKVGRQLANAVSGVG